MSKPRFTNLRTNAPKPFDEDYKNSNVMSEREHGLFLVGCFVIGSIIVLAMAGGLMYLIG